MYYIIVQRGAVFEGSMKEFRKKFYDYPEIWSDEKVLAHAKEWAETNSWTFEFSLLN
jgi:uncharacterized Fe-S cluster-containing MiaB family protein